MKPTQQKVPLPTGDVAADELKRQRSRVIPPTPRQHLLGLDDYRATADQAWKRIVLFCYDHGGDLSKFPQVLKEAESCFLANRSGEFNDARPAHAITDILVLKFFWYLNQTGRLAGRSTVFSWADEMYHDLNASWRNCLIKEAEQFIESSREGNRP